MRLGEREPGFRRVGANDGRARTVEVLPEHIDSVAMVIDDEDRQANQRARRSGAHGPGSKFVEEKSIALGKRRGGAAARKFVVARDVSAYGIRVIGHRFCGEKIFQR